ncbi:hypothetical protein BDY21DRAFT_186698 [Lineolata rhizophorae]|uniref:Uncharacterized protein n=1 Tax=Lineolata rhizophorae TaxID=578093 RepID=A0A6A6P883_9PEZI|nr:hypothetical protein BDY21DRAFT_186698 [Lineolata rhizophorae]
MDIFLTIHAQSSIDAWWLHVKANIKQALCCHCIHDYVSGVCRLSWHQSIVAPRPHWSWQTSSCSSRPLLTLPSMGMTQQCWTHSGGANRANRTARRETRTPFPDFVSLVATGSAKQPRPFDLAYSSFSYFRPIKRSSFPETLFSATCLHPVAKPDGLVQEESQASPTLPSF